MNWLAVFFGWCALAGFAALGGRLLANLLVVFFGWCALAG